jgi:outer membrane protein insertion porin family
MSHGLLRRDSMRRSGVALRAYVLQVCVAIALSTACIPLAAQEPSAPTPIVSDVRVVQEGVQVTDPDVLSLILTSVGKPLSSVEVAESRRHLDGLNRYENVVVESEPVAGGVRLTYAVTPLRPIDQIEFRGNLQLPQSTLRLAVRERLGSTLSPSRLPAAEGLLRERYRDKGYANPDIRSQVVPRSRPYRSTLVYTIDAGARLKLKEVRPNQLDPKELLVGLPDVKAGEPYDADRIQSTLDKYLDAMRRNGFYEARVEPHAEFEPDGVVLNIDVRRGPRVRLVFNGDPLSRSDQERLVPLRAEGTVNEDLLENATRDIEQDLRIKGYNEARAPHTRVENENELTITFDIMRGPKFVIADVVVNGLKALREEDLKQPLEILKAGQPFIESVAEGVAREIQDLYANKGFVQVMVTGNYPATAPETKDAPRRVHVSFNIVEGAEVKLRSVTFSGNSAVSTAELLDVFSKEGVTVSGPYYEEKVQAALLAIEIFYKDRGFERMQMPRARRTVVIAGDQRDLLIPIEEGPQIFVDRVIIEGNERTSRETIERELQLVAGQPLGATARLQSEARLRDLGLFRRVRIDERRHDDADDPRVDVIVHVEEALRTTLGYGGGLEVSQRLRPTGPDNAAEERLDFVPRAFFEIGRRNMWGKNRSVNLFTRISGKSEDTVTPLGQVESSYGVNEYRVLATFREPKVAGTPAQALFTGIAERAIRTSYSFVTREVRAEVGGNVKEHYNASVRFSVKKADLFDVDPGVQKPVIDRLFPQVRLSKIGLSLIRNTRQPNDLDPTSGTFLTADPEVAARLLGSEVGYVKGLMQLSWYHQLPFERRTILAFRGVLGMAHGFARVAPALDVDGNPIFNDDGSPKLETVQDLPASERFFAGGSTSNRGFSVDLLGVRSTDPNKTTFTTTGFPTGGDGELLLNSEVRVTLVKALAGVAFFDAGNIYKSAGDIRLQDLRPAVGGGVHIISPFGPIRFEVGVNLNRQFITNGDPNASPPVPGVRERGFVFHISLGPAF